MINILRSYLDKYSIRRIIMEILGFKDWYENKEKSGSILKNAKAFLGEKINPLLYKINSKVLTLHLDDSGSDPVKTNHKVQRYLIDEEASTEPLMWKLREFLVKECNEGKKAFIVGYDTSNTDPRKTYRSAKKLAEGFKNKLALDFIQSRSFGNIEKMNDVINETTRDFNKTRIELWIMDLRIEDLIEKEIPFLFNPNDYTLLDKYKTTLRGLLYKLILSENKRNIKISCMKPWPSAKRAELNESLTKQENLREVFLYKYVNPGKFAISDPDNKPKPLSEKISVKKLTDKRSESICSFLNQYTINYGFSFIPIGMGVREGASKIIIEVL